MNELQITLLKTFLKEYKKGNVDVQSIIQHIECIVDKKEVDTTLKLNNYKYRKI